MRNVVLLNKDGEAYKAGVYSNDGISVIISLKKSSELNSTLSKGELPRSKGNNEVWFALVRYDKIGKFDHRIYDSTYMARLGFGIVTPKGIDKRIVDEIGIWLIQNCTPIVQCECVGVQGGVITLILPTGEIAHYRQEGLLNRDKVDKLITSGKVNSSVRLLDTIPKNIELVSKSQVVSTLRKYTER
jgi:hypothetical protein